jgi:hypothetical protein
VLLICFSPCKFGYRNFISNTKIGLGLKILFSVINLNRKQFANFKKQELKNGKVSSLLYANSEVEIDTCGCGI